MHPEFTKLWLRFPLPLALGAMLAGCSREAEAPTPATPAEDHAETRVHRGTNGEVIVTLDPATQKVMGLQTSPLAPASLKPEIKAYGRVLDAAPLAALTAELASANAANATAQTELKRLETLAAQNNASQRVLQAAQAEALRNQAQLESVRLRLLTGWGSAIAGRQDLPAFVQSLGALQSALVQLNVPAGEGVNAAPVGARILPAGGDRQPAPGQFVSPAPTVDPQVQGQGFLFLVEPNDLRLAPGASVSGFLVLPGEPQAGVAAPRNALVRFNGTAWVYLQTGETRFERREVPLDHPLPDGWFVSQGFKPGDRIVTTGGQLLLSEELKRQGLD